jgi:hypothetical protein
MRHVRGCIAHAHARKRHFISRKTGHEHKTSHRHITQYISWTHTHLPSQDITQTHNTIHLMDTYTPAFTRHHTDT